MVSEDIKIQILEKEFYTANELAKAGFIKNNRGNANDYNFILKEIKSGVLKATDMNRDEDAKNPSYRITAEAIIEYLGSF